MSERVIEGRVVRFVTAGKGGDTISLTLPRPRLRGEDEPLGWKLRYGAPTRQEMIAADSVLGTFENLLDLDEKEAIRRLRILRRAYRRKQCDVYPKLEAVPAAEHAQKGEG